jgi:AmmeMemoRadiSam system protein B
MSSPIAATRKPYATPFGAASVDHEFLDALEAVYPGDLYADELSHRAEHSLEFQAVYLRYLERVGDGSSHIVPILCGSLQEWAASDGRLTFSPVVDAVVQALRSALTQTNRRVCRFAGADLAHVGPQFGDEDPVDAARLRRVGADDQAMLELICRGDARGFYEQVMIDEDARRICGLSPIYYLLALLGQGDGRCLKYSQWVDPAGQGSVTFAGVIFEG